MIANIPDTLYKNNVIYFPDIIQRKYIDLLKEYNLYDNAKKFKKEKDLIGGCDKDTTLEHFSQRFLTSGSRTGYITINPNGKFKMVQQNIFESLLYGNINILDLPCGTGGSTFNLLCTIGDLLEKKCFSTLPISLNILAADFSDTALEIYDKFIIFIKPKLKSIGIEINYSLRKWNAFCPIQTTDLMDCFLSSKFDESIIMINNFSGALNKDKDKKFYDILEKCIISRMVNYKFSFLWIEPNSNDSINIFKIFIKKCLDVLKKIFNSSKNIEGTDNYKWYNFITEAVVSNGSINLKMYKRN